ncbi:MAG: hypothetical protein AN485_22860, partial [Anabaena sp. MDT14b]
VILPFPPRHGGAAGVAEQQRGHAKHGGGGLLTSQAPPLQAWRNQSPGLVREAPRGWGGAVGLGLCLTDKPHPSAAARLLPSPKEEGGNSSPARGRNKYRLVLILSSPSTCDGEVAADAPASDDGGAKDGLS